MLTLVPEEIEAYAMAHSSPLPPLLHELIRGLPEAAWSHTIEHSEYGMITMDQWFGVHSRHVPDHIDQVERIRAALAG